ncbi:MAG: hypothetical protein U5L03_12255 [Burkholderiaceae bacterium]|nr:hypothetical protein [Burkholderiaceae bacterium]
MLGAQDKIRADKPAEPKKEREKRETLLVYDFWCRLRRRASTQLGLT